MKYSPHNGVGLHPLFTQNNQVYFHCSRVLPSQPGFFIGTGCQVTGSAPSSAVAVVRSLASIAGPANFLRIRPLTVTVGNEGL